MHSTTELDLPAPPDIELRVLHGPQAGSRLALEDSLAYTVGSGDGCAILLAGAQVEAEHATIEAGPEGIRIFPRQGKVVDLSRTELAAGTTVPLGTVLQIGRVKLTVDSAAAPWPVEETVAPPEPEPELEADPVSPALQSDEPPGQGAAPANAAAIPAARGRMRDLRSGNLLAKASVATVVLLLALSAAGAAWLQAEAGRDTAARPASDAAKSSAPRAPASASTFPDTSSLVADLVRVAGARGGLFTYRSPVGGWVIAGRVARASERAWLQNAADGITPTPQVKVWLDKERIEQVNVFLSDRNEAGAVELRAELGDAGAVRIVGSAADAARAAERLQALQEERPDLAPFESRVAGRDQLRALFLDQLRSAGLAGKLKVVRDAPDIYLEGALSPQEVARWESMFVAFSQSHGSVLTIGAEVRSERDGIERHIEAVVGGAFPYVITTTGRRVSPGGMLEGRTLASVRDGELVFTDGMRMRYAQ
jgi:type III secretion system YscD/HrpQ family protein